MIAEGVPGPPLFVATDTVPDPPGAPEFHAKTHSSISLMWFPARTDFYDNCQNPSYHQHEDGKLIITGGSHTTKVKHTKH